MGFWTKNKNVQAPLQESTLEAMPIPENKDESQLPALPQIPNDYPVIDNDEDFDKEQAVEIKKIQTVKKEDSLDKKIADIEDEEAQLTKRIEELQAIKFQKQKEAEEQLKRKEAAEFETSDSNQQSQTPIYLTEAECLREILSLNYNINKKLDLLLFELSKPNS